MKPTVFIVFVYLLLMAPLLVYLRTGSEPYPAILMPGGKSPTANTEVLSFDSYRYVYYGKRTGNIPDSLAFDAVKLLDIPPWYVSYASNSIMSYPKWLAKISAGDGTKPGSDSDKQNQLPELRRWLIKQLPKQDANFRVDSIAVYLCSNQVSVSMQSKTITNQEKVTIECQK
jgi:hypothetical protein